ncbi:hypothetical protein HFP70_35885 [Streptomyces sp. ARC14]|uniref:hypothetical protein n=1 Tax=Streptomyces sp. ARC14 TaxID=2724152 RepID=UPI00385726D5
MVVVPGGVLHDRETAVVGQGDPQVRVVGHAAQGVGLRLAVLFAGTGVSTAALPERAQFVVVARSPALVARRGLGRADVADGDVARRDTGTVGDLLGGLLLGGGGRGGSGGGRWRWPASSRPARRTPSSTRPICPASFRPSGVLIWSKASGVFQSSGLPSRWASSIRLAKSSASPCGRSR